MWKTRKRPVPLNYEEVDSAAQLVSNQLSRDNQKTWSLAENFAVFADSLRRLSERLNSAQANAVDGFATPVLQFDKDDEDTLDFVAAAANLRSIVFQIETKSKFDIKRNATMF